jgi:uncharacterized membrane protein
MANEKTLDNAGAGFDRASIRTIGTGDLKDALVRGLADFNAKPSHLIFIAMIYPVVMLVAARLTAGYEILPLVFPLLAGSALLGPLAAIGLYELSRRREQGLDVAWRHLFDVLRSPSLGSILILGILLGAIFLAWMVMAQIIYWHFFGASVPESVTEFARQILTTSAGWSLIVAGCGVGFLFAVVVLTVSVISFPLLLDRDVGPVTAVQTSISVVLTNPFTMTIWGGVVAGSLVLGALPLFVGWAIVMPVLGHSTWHLYRIALGR